MDLVPIGSDLSEIKMVGLPHLDERYQFLLIALQEEHPGRILDEAKSFLESIFRTIAIDVSGEEARGEIERLHMPELCQRACDCTTLSDDETVHVRIAEACRGLVVAIAQVRNGHGSSSHGRDGQFVSIVGLKEAVFLAQTAVSIGALFFNRHKGRTDRSQNGRLQYLDNPEFNEYLDQQEDVVVAGISMLPSQTLFNNEPKAYRVLLNEFLVQDETIEEND